MKRFVGLTLLFSGLILIFFISNIVLYSRNKCYHDALIEAVTGREEADIPVVDVSRDAATVCDDDVIYRDLDLKELDEEDVPLSPTYTEDPGDENIGSNLEYTDIDVNRDEPEEENKGKDPVIVDKEYHEDCGSGKGYWIIKYEDGNTAIEQ